MSGHEAADRLRPFVEWHAAYDPAWDDTPDLYADNGIVPWGKSRRLGLLKFGEFKAYLGVQHVDPEKPGWNIVEAPEARFFMSAFAAGRCITLRTFPSMDAALSALAMLLGAPDA